MLPSLAFVLGGAASGKSQLAESIILNSQLTPVYLATSRIRDPEVQQKVDVHRARRGSEWTTINAEVDVATPLANCDASQIVLLDCATMWLTNVMLDELDLDKEVAYLLDALQSCTAPVVVVSNEVGQGIVPDNALARQFREAQGRLNIALAAQADCVIHVVAGLQNILKGTAP